MESRELYLVTATDPDGLRDQLNFILQQVTDRLDAAERLRGGMDDYDKWDLAYNALYIDPATGRELLDIDTTDFGNITVTRLRITDDNDTVIHQMGE
jgi:hypothetical protein